MNIYQISTDSYDLKTARQLRDDLIKKTGLNFYIVHLGSSCDDPSKKIS